MCKTIRLLLLAICIWGTPSGLSAQQVRIKLENCKVPPEVYNQIRHALDIQAQFYKDLFGELELDTMKARLFPNEATFRRFSKKNLDYKPSPHTLGFYSSKSNEMVLHLEIKDFIKTFRHELSHAMMAQYCSERRSIWIDEGIAEYLEDITYQDSTFMLQKSYLRKVSRVRWILLGDFDLEDTIYTRNFSKYSDNHYETAWAAVFYLINKAPEYFKIMTKDLCNSEYEMTEILYPGGIQLLETDTKSYFLNFNPF